MSTSAEVAAIFRNAIQKPGPRARSNARAAVTAAQIELLQRCISDIRRKARETPAWAAAYNSSITTLEVELLALTGAARQ